MIDGHTHLDSLADADAAVESAIAGGLVGMVSVGQEPDSNVRTLEIADRYPGVVRACVGVHPQKAATWDASRWDEVETAARSPHVCAIGETGFDQYRDWGPVGTQLELFERHIDLARRTALPLVIHTRAAEQVTLDTLARFADGLVVVMHCFSMPARIDEIVERGYIISVAGNVTYPSAGDLRAAVERVPSELLVVETDAPYLTPVPHRGTKNEPRYVACTIDCIAEVRGESVEAVRGSTTATAARVYGFDIDATDIRPDTPDLVG